VHQEIHNRQIILYEGHHRRTFMHIKDCVAVYLFGIDHFEAMKGNTYNVGDEIGNYTKKEIAELIHKYVDFYLHEANVGEDLDKRDYEVSYLKLKTLGYRAEISVEEGVKELVKILKFVRFKNPWRNHG
jgi:nucleoside-diphosphate-sugar epimerase